MNIIPGQGISCAQVGSWVAAEVYIGESGKSKEPGKCRWEKLCGAREGERERARSERQGVVAR